MAHYNAKIHPKRFPLYEVKPREATFRLAPNAGESEMILKRVRKRGLANAQQGNKVWTGEGSV